MSHRSIAVSPVERISALTPSRVCVLRRLSTPQKIQSFLNAICINHETGGETILSVREVLAQRRAHCIEAAFVAACAFWVHGEPPLVMHLDCAPTDYPHVIALFRRGRDWGAISKSNGTPLRYRDPVYRSLRELAMSYFHEYSDRHGRKTLRSYSVAFDLRRIDPELWVTNAHACLETNDRLASARHYPLVTPRQQRCSCGATLSSATPRRWWNIRRRRRRKQERKNPLS